MSGAKAGGLAFLLLAASAFFVDSSHGLFAVLRVVFWVLLAAHVVEVIASLPRLRAAPGSTLGHVLQVMVFGVFHLRELPKGT